ncbi:DUF7266 family protein [Halarchaeum rubridurum]|nr:hypothetical protein [Halarchaeum rubridurum]GGM65624.1 hypothetical protein GCM10009017_14650 [Halarchaeum rubridurum]
MGDDRGAATALGYVLNITVALLLVTGLLIAVTDYVDRQRQDAVRGQLAVVSDRLVADLAAADRLAGTADAGGVTVRSDAPARVVGRTYTIRVSHADGVTRVRLAAPSENVVVTRTLHTDRDVVNATVTGGDVEITTRGAAGDGLRVVSDD